MAGAGSISLGMLEGGVAAIVLESGPAPFVFDERLVRELSAVVQGLAARSDLSGVVLRSTHPDVFCAGIKEKYVIQKMGVACKQLHNYDVGGPYNAFRGAVNFYRDIDRMVNSPVWKLTSAPWELETA